jgi:signal transduction histidine kinase
VQKEDKVVCEELARRAGMAIDNAQLYHAADSANQAKDSFLAALSHELRTPLTHALLLSESLLSTCVCTLSVVRTSFKTLTVLTYGTAEGALSERAEESMQMIHESVELEVRLIDDLLDFTKISRYARPHRDCNLFLTPARTGLQRKHDIHSRIRL